MQRLTQKDPQGNWSLKGIPWESLHIGQVITKELWKKLYGALWKLMEYEHTGLSPEEAESLKQFEGSNTQKYLIELGKHRWIPVSKRLPEDDNYILLSFSNFSLPLVGRYEQNELGGVFYVGDCDGEDTCLDNDLYVNAWMPLPESYKGADND